MVTEELQDCTSSVEETCHGCGRPVDAAHTAECLIALLQDAEDGDAEARAALDAEGICDDILCTECGLPTLEDSASPGVLHHMNLNRNSPGDIDHDQDADHVARVEESTKED